jgi:hypothetical protein
LKIRNLEHKYKTTRAQLLRKVDGAQSCIKKKPIPPKYRQYAPHLDIKPHPKSLNMGGSFGMKHLEIYSYTIPKNPLKKYGEEWLRFEQTKSYL